MHEAERAWLWNGWRTDGQLHDLAVDYRLNVKGRSAIATVEDPENVLGEKILHACKPPKGTPKVPVLSRLGFVGAS